MDELTPKQAPDMTPISVPDEIPVSPGGSSQRGLFLLFGVMLGAAVVLVTLHFAQPTPGKVAELTGTSPSAPIQTSHPNGPPSTQPSSPGPQTSAPPQPANPKPSGPGGTAGGTPATQSKPGTNAQPFNPFDGSISQTMPPKEISGHITPGAEVTLPNPGDAANITPAPPIESPPKSLLVTIRLDVADPSQAIKDIQAIAAKVSGTAIQFDESATKLDPEGAILFVPAAKEADAEKLVGTVGSLVVSDNWTGPATDRLDKMEEDANNRLSQLHVRRQELLVKYFEDAPQIKHIDEDSDRITKCLASLRAQKPGANTAVIKIKFMG